MGEDNLKVLIIGHSPAKGKEDEVAIFNGCQTGNRLTYILEKVTPFLETETVEFDTVNLYTQIEGKLSCNSLPNLNNYDCTISLGKEVGDKINEEYFFDWNITIPHPSGLNRYWNKENSEVKVVNHLIEFINLCYSVRNKVKVFKTVSYFNY